MITRDRILDQIQQVLEPQPKVFAMWEGGAAAFERLDQYSDVDIQVDVADEFVARTFELVEEALLELAPLQDKYVVPQPTWHGFHQTFYRLAGSSEFLMIDLAVIHHSSPNKFLQAEIHGRYPIRFDKANIVVSPPFDHNAHATFLQGRIAEQAARMRMVGNLVQKELLRGQPLDAFGFYQGLIIRPLVELLRIKYDPTRYQFHLRYLRHYAPPEVLGKLERLIYTGSLDDLAIKLPEAEAWFWALVAELSEESDE